MRPPPLRRHLDPAGRWRLAPGLVGGGALLVFLAGTGGLLHAWASGWDTARAAAPTTSTTSIEGVTSWHRTPADVSGQEPLKPTAPSATSTSGPSVASTVTVPPVSAQTPQGSPREAAGTFSGASPVPSGTPGSSTPIVSTPSTPPSSPPSTSPTTSTTTTSQPPSTTTAAPTTSAPVTTTSPTQTTPTESEATVTVPDVTEVVESTDGAD